MATYTDRIVLVFPIAAKNRPVAASLQTLEITESGREFENLVPLDPALVNQYADEFNLGWESEKTQLVAAHKTALSELETTNKTQAELISTLLAKLQDLEQYRPFNPRIIDASAFYARVTKDEFATLSTSDDPQLGAIARAILAYKTNDWPVVFDSQEMQGMLGYLLSVGFLTNDRVLELTRDATREEAYSA